MANKRIDMSKLRQMLRLYSQGESKLKISELTGISRNTLKSYLKRWQRLGISLPVLETKSDHELDKLFGINQQPEPGDRYKTLEQYFPTMEKELKKRGVTRYQLWSKYILKHPDGFKISQFKDHYRKWLKMSNPDMHIEHKSGDKMYIDFAGEKLHLIDLQTGEIIPVEVFLSVLGAS